MVSCCSFSEPMTETKTLACCRSADDLGARDGDALDARVLELEQDRVGRGLADHFGYTG